MAIGAFFIFWKTHFLEVWLPKLLGFMVLARDLSPLNSYSHENENKGNKENLKSWIISKQEHNLKNLDVKAIYKNNNLKTWM